MIVIKTNYHTHTSRCNHASGTDEEYVLSALRGGFDVLGFSDHSPWPYSGNFRSSIRMSADMLDGYVASIASLREKYESQIEVKIGLECEYFPEYMPWLKEQRERFRLDYLLFGNHFSYREEKSLYFGNSHTPADLRLYLESAVQGLQSSLFECMAHPDLFMQGYYRFDEHCERVANELCLVANEHGVALEYNCSQAFCPEFWKIAGEQKCRVVIGIDAHHPRDLEDVDGYRRALNNLKKLGVAPGNFW